MVAIPAPNVFPIRHKSIEFLDWFFEDGAQWPLIAIRDGVPPLAATFAQAPKRAVAAERWITDHNSDGYNIYFAINPLKAALAKKAAKSDIAAAEWLFVDIDPPKTLTPTELDGWRDNRRMELCQLPGGLPDFTWSIDSGRGFWLFWRLRSPQPVDGKDGELTTAIEAVGRAIERLFGADHCCNIDRVARLPGTINHKTGRVASVMRMTEDAYDLDDFPAPIAAPIVATAPIENPTSTSTGELDDVDAWLRDLVTAEVDPDADHSNRFHAVVTGLTEHGWNISQIETLANANPNFVPPRYVKQNRVRREIERCAPKAKGRVEAPAVAPLKAAATPYPIDYLGDALADAARAIAAKIQCPLEMTAGSVLSVASLAAQALADVRLPYLQTRPLSLFFLIIAASGDRKTSSDKEAKRPIEMREKQLRAAHEPLAQKHAAALAAYRAQKVQIEKSRGDVHDKESQLNKLGLEPEAPLRPILTLGDSTAEGLTKHLPSFPGALGLFSSEGGMFLGGYGFSKDAIVKTAAAFSSFWDGDPVRGLRSGVGYIDNPGRRLACHLMTQPDGGMEALANPILRNQGFLARFLIAAPETMAGERPWQEPADGIEPAILRFIAKIMDIFDIRPAAANTAGNELTPRVLELSTEAKSAWIDFYNHVERAQKRGGYAAGLRDVAGKSAEQAARIAGVLAMVDDPHATEIDGDAMLRGCGLAQWYLGEAIRLAATAKEAAPLQDAEVLKAWILKDGQAQVTASRLLQFGPFRNKPELYPVIAKLEKSGFLVPIGKSGGRAWQVG